MISANGICKSFNNGSVNVLRGISLEINDGEFAVILGASGSGKSTLLNVLSGLERADGGSIVCNGCELDKMTEKQLTEFRRKYVGYVFQQYYLLGHLNVESNVRLGADLVGNKNYKDTIAAVGLGDKLKSMPSELSGGEQQRVCIARALAKQPLILFADEPTGALDEQTGRKVLEYITDLKRKCGFTLVMVTHNRNIAQIADKVISINSGVITDVTINDTPACVKDIDW